MDTWRRTHDWGALTRQEIAAARDAGALAVLTVGSCEQHADHLPVDTDTVSAHRVATLAAEQCRSPHVLVLPPPSFGFSPHHLAWPGTVSLSLQTFMGLVADVAESLHRTGFDRLLIVNGHGGNIGPLAAACTELVSRGLRVGAVTYFAAAGAGLLSSIPGARQAVGHACAYETSIQLALRPGERQQIAGRAHGLPPRLAPAYVEGEDLLAGFGVSYAALFPAGDPGYSGDPAAATVADGERLLKTTVDALAELYPRFSAAVLKVGNT